MSERLDINRAEKLFAQPNMAARAMWAAHYGPRLIARIRELEAERNGHDVCLKHWNAKMADELDGARREGGE